ncbi:MAG: DNA cytosine methyltransferase [Candidatus Odinarchaeota archaeon]
MSLVNRDKSITDFFISSTPRDELISNIPFVPYKTDCDRIFDLFCGGLGSFTQAVEFYGGRADFALDICPVATKTYSMNYKTRRVIQTDVTSFAKILFDFYNGGFSKADFDGFRIDLKELQDLFGITFGFPCKRFSKRNVSSNVLPVIKKHGLAKIKRMPEYQDAFLYDSCLDIVEVVKPLYVIIENVDTVPRVIIYDIIKRLRKLGYSVSVLAVKDMTRYACMQPRPRTIWVAIRGNFKHFSLAGHEDPNTTKLIEICEPETARSHFTRDTPRFREKIDFARKVVAGKAYMVKNNRKIQIKKNDWFPYPWQNSQYDNGAVMDENATKFVTIANPDKNDYFYFTGTRVLTIKELLALFGIKTDHKFPFWMKGATKNKIGDIIGCGIPVPFLIILLTTIHQQLGTVFTLRRV